MTLNLPEPLLNFVQPLALPENTDFLGKMLGKALLNDGSGGVIYLQGELGAGKTALVRALLRSCGVEGRIKAQVTPYLKLIKFLAYTSIILIFIDLRTHKNGKRQALEIYSI